MNWILSYWKRKKYFQLTVIIITIKVIKIVAIFMSGWLPSHALTCRAVSNQTDTYEYHILVQPPCCHLIFSVISHSTTIVQSILFFSGNIFPVESFSLVMITRICVQSDWKWELRLTEEFLFASVSIYPEAAAAYIYLISIPAARVSAKFKEKLD